MNLTLLIQTVFLSSPNILSTFWKTSRPPFLPQVIFPIYPPFWQISAMMQNDYRFEHTLQNRTTFLPLVWCTAIFIRAEQRCEKIILFILNFFRLVPWTSISLLSFSHPFSKINFHDVRSVMYSATFRSIYNL